MLKVDTAIDVKFTAPGNNSSVSSLKPLFKGTGEPGASIRVHGNTRDVATTQVKADGTWEAKASIALGDKVGYDLFVTQTPTNTAAPSTDRVHFGIAFRDAAEVSVTTPANGSTVTQKRPKITGTGDAGSTITIMGTTKVIATAKVNADGSWSADAQFDLSNTGYNVIAKQVDANGDAKQTAFSFTVYAH